MIALPLILFSTNILDYKKLAKTTILSFILLIVSVMLVSSIIGIVAYKKGLNDALNLSGMATGLYIGGTPNLFAIGEAISNDINIINAANISDSVVGGIYILFVLGFGKKIYGILPKNKNVEYEKQEIKQTDDYFVLSKINIRKLLLNVLLAILCFGTGILIEYMINGNIDGSLYIVLTVSILGIVLSFIPSVRNVKGNYQAGHYLLLIFSFALSLSVDFNALKTSMIPILIFFSITQILSIIIHFILCAIFKIDGGTALITSIAGIYGPPFIAPVAKAYDDNRLLVPGIICGVIGLAIGNILGISLSSILKLFII